MNGFSLMMIVIGFFVFVFVMEVGNVLFYKYRKYVKYMEIVMVFLDFLDKEVCVGSVWFMVIIMQEICIFNMIEIVLGLIVIVIVMDCGIVQLSELRICVYQREGIVGSVMFRDMIGN